ncbi:EAL domain-containing response regulator [Vibrio sp.]|uniref:EAL domain-containing response regulator n=1 Tax=Vibrio sp. TaxID=678 RepID=UPI003D0D61F3
MNNTKIVVIDDSQAILLLMSSMLAELGYDQVVTFCSPVKALNAIRENPEQYSAVFIDLNMPDVDGMAVIRELGKINYHGGVCIVSAMESRVIKLAADIARQHRVSLIGNIAKPVEKHTLKRVFNRFNELIANNAHTTMEMTKDELLDCLEQKYFTPYYQPQVDIFTNRVTGLEALARIAKPGIPNAILPGSFLPTAMRHGLLNAITDQLFEKAFDDLPALTAEFGKQVKLSLNLSPSQLVDPHYPEYLHSLIKRHNADIRQIVLEITEELALKSTEQLETLNRFRIRGFGLSLDDYGTGFTNLQELRSLPFTEIKIDRCLIQDIHCDRFNQVVVKSLAQIAGQLNVLLVAEGIEDFADYHYLETNMKALHVQGYLICKPRSMDSLLRWHHSWIHSKAC